SSRPGRRLGLGIPPKRLTTRAPFIAVVDADGSGKSRLTTDLAKWLRWKLSVRHLYLGQPKSGFVFKLLNKARQPAPQHGGGEAGKCRRLGAAGRRDRRPEVGLSRQQAEAARRRGTAGGGQRRGRDRRTVPAPRV